MPTTPIRLLLADDHPPILDWLPRLLEPDPVFETVGQATRADTAIAEAAALRPDLLILDYCLPGPPAAEVVCQVEERSPETRILVYTGYPTAACLREVRALRVAGYLPKTAPAETVREAIGVVARGGTWFPRDVPERPATGDLPCPALAEREREVLRLLVEGLTDDEIAATVHVTSRAVRYTLRALYDKFGVDGRVQAAVRAVRLGLVEEGEGSPECFRKRKRQDFRFLRNLDKSSLLSWSQRAARVGGWLGRLGDWLNHRALDDLAGWDSHDATRR